MNWFDIVIIGCLVISVLYSLLKGMTREIFSLVAIFLGYWVANSYYSNISFIFTKFISNKNIASSLAFFSLFLFVSIVVGLAGRFVKKMMKMSKAFSFLDRFGGGLIGFMKAVIVISLVMIPLNVFPKLRQEIINSSKIAPLFLSSSKILAKISLNDTNLFKQIETKRMVKKIKKLLHENMDTLKRMEKLGIMANNGKGKLPSPKIHISKSDKDKLNSLLKKVEGDSK